MLIIAFIILLLFGGKKIPEMMRGLGRGVKSFKDGMKEDEEFIITIPLSEKEEDSDEREEV